MLFIAGKPILQYVVEALARNGIRDVVLVVGYKKEQIFDYMGSGESFGATITYITQDRQLGTAHALTQAEEVIEDEFLLLPGDNLIEADTIAQFTLIRPEAVLVKKVDNPVRYGVVNISKGVVTEIVEKPHEAIGNVVSTGIYALTKEIFGFIEPELDLPDVLNNMITSGHSIVAMETNGTWLDVIYPWDILNLNDAILRQVQPSIGGIIEAAVSLKGQVSIGKDTVVRSNSYISGPVVVGDGCDIGPNVCIMPATSIGNNVVISPFTEIKNSVIGDDANIGPGCTFQDSVIDRGCVIDGHFTACSGQNEVRVNHERHMVSVGAMLGEGCKLGNSVVGHCG
jgi:glucose-1-phosphate thymidylyltransferase